MAIYLDYNASMPPHPEVVDAMLPWMRDWHANPHSDHLAGRRADGAIQQAKASIAELVGADADEILLTSGATESNNIVLQGYLGQKAKPGTLIHSTTEHKSVLETAAALAMEGCEVVAVDVNGQGYVDPVEIRAAVDAAKFRRTLVSLIHANNEIGTVQSLEGISASIQGSSAVFHSDASQSAGRLPLDVSSMGNS